MSQETRAVSACPRNHGGPHMFATKLGRPQCWCGITREQVAKGGWGTWDTATREWVGTPGLTRREVITLTAEDEGENMGLEARGDYYDRWARAHDRQQTTLTFDDWLDLPAASDVHGNLVAREGVDRCTCGNKYWEQDRCVDCGAHVSEVTQ
jgi:hypothetical protein